MFVLQVSAPFAGAQSWSEVALPSPSPSVRAFKGKVGDDQSDDLALVGIKGLYVLEVEALGRDGAPNAPTLDTALRVLNLLLMRLPTG